MKGEKAHIREAEARTGINPVRAIEVYLSRIAVIREVARAHGYAIGIHGSMKRDLDLIAVPWVDKVSAPAKLASAIEVAVSGFILHRQGDKRDKTGGTKKPHGRRAWSIHLGGGPYIDLSVFPSSRK